MRKCRQCKTRLPKLKECETPHQRAGFCHHWCAESHIKANRTKIRQKAMRAREKAHKQQKFKVVSEDLSKQKELTQRSVNRLARLLDKMQGYGCVSCGRPDDGSVQFCGGHYLSRGAHPEMRFDLRNIHSQCNRYCNMALSGNINGDKNTRGFRQGLVDRYGQGYVDWLEGAHDPKNYTCEDLIAMRKEINKEIRLLESGEEPRYSWRALPDAVK